MRGHTSAEKNPPQRKTHSLTGGLSRIMGAFSSREISMRFMPSVLRFAALSVGVALATPAMAATSAVPSRS